MDSDFHAAHGANVTWTTAPVPSSRICLLYTSDAADERSSVDLGGRRIIKKKKKTTCLRVMNKKLKSTTTTRVPHTYRDR